MAKSSIEGKRSQRVQFLKTKCNQRITKLNVAKKEKAIIAISGQKLNLTKLQLKVVKSKTTANM